MKNYYDKNLSAERLRLAYELATPRVRQYLDAEISFVLDRLRPSDIVMELGCGYGRVLERLVPKSKLVVGVDTSSPSLSVAAESLAAFPNLHLVQMNAANLAFPHDVFDRVVCIQNGLSAFHVDPARLIRESVRVTKKGGLVLLSSYSGKFWEERLEWFRIQAEHGLIGEIDWEATRNGEIACKDGFRGTTFSPDDLAALVYPLGLPFEIYEVDGSSLFCEIAV